MSQMSENRDRLRGEWVGIKSKWATARQDWCDNVGDRFEQEYWKNLESEMPRLFEAMQHLENVLGQALRHTD